MPDMVFTSTDRARVIADLDAIQSKTKTQAQIARDNNRAMQQLARETTGVFRSVTTEQERIVQKIGTVKEALKAGLIPKDLGQEALTRLQTKLDATAGDAKEAGDKIGGVFGEAGPIVKGMLGTLAGLASVQKAISVIRSEIDAAREQADRAARLRLSVSESRNLVLRNLDTNPEVRAQVLETTQAIAARTNVGEQFINAAFVDASSAASGNIPLATAAVEGAARFLPDQPSNIGEFAGTLIDLSRSTGSGEAAVNLGLLSSVGRLSRITSARLQAKNIAPALIGASAFDTPAREGGALFAAITTGAADRSGEQSGTATIQLAKQLREFAQSTDDTVLAAADAQVEKAQDKLKDLEAKAAAATERAAETDTPGARRVADAQKGFDRAIRERRGGPAIEDAVEQLRRAEADAEADRTRRQEAAEAAQAAVLDGRTEVAGALGAQAEARRTSAQREAFRQRLAAGTTAQRIQLLQSNPELARDFLNQASFEVKALGPIEQLLLNPRSQVAQDFRAGLQAIPGLDGLRIQGNRMLDFGANELNAAAERERAILATRDTLDLASPDLLGQPEREAIRDILQRTTGSRTGADVRLLLAELGDGTVGVRSEDVVRTLSAEAARLEQGAFLGGTYNNGSAFLQATPEELAAAEQLRNLAAILTKQLEEQKKTNDKLEANPVVVGGN